jgi:hypothetical protein
MIIPELSELSLVSILLGFALGFVLGALFTALVLRPSDATMERWWAKKISTSMLISQHNKQTQTEATPGSIVPKVAVPAPTAKLPKRKVGKPEPTTIASTSTLNAAPEVTPDAGQYKYKVVGAGPPFRSLEEALTVFPAEMRPVGATWETLPDKIKSMIERISVEDVRK